MRFLRLGVTLMLPALALVPAAAFASDGASNRPDVVAALKTIRSDADAVAAGKFQGRAALQAPAREIALQWQKIEPVLATDGNVLVETKMANATVATFEKDWQSKRDIRGEAKDLSGTIGDLVDAERGKT